MQKPAAAGSAKPCGLGLPEVSNLLAKFDSFLLSGCRRANARLDFFLAL
jgi:hypothetical protein